MGSFVKLDAFLEWTLSAEYTRWDIVIEKNFLSFKGIVKMHDRKRGLNIFESDDDCTWQMMVCETELSRSHRIGAATHQSWAKL